MNNHKSTLESPKIPIFPLYQSNPLGRVEINKTKEKVSGPDPFNYDHIRYSDIKIR